MGPHPTSARTTTHLWRCACCSLLALACSAAATPSESPAKLAVDRSAEPQSKSSVDERGTVPEDSNDERNDGDDDDNDRETKPVKPDAKKSPSKLATGRQILRSDAPAGLREFAQELQASGDRGNLWVGSLRGNGDRPALIYIPAGADPNADFRIVVHFHGTYSEHVERRREGLKKRSWVGWDRLQQTVDGAIALQARGPENIALVYPLSAGKRMEPEWKGWSNKAYDRMWMHPSPPTYTDDFSVLLDESETILEESFGVHPSRLPRRVTVEGHSAGGIALWNIARTDEGRVADYLFLDAGFHLWADGCYAALTDRRTQARVILVIRDQGIADPMEGPNAWCAQHPPLVKAWPEVAEQCEGSPKHRPKQAPGDGKISCQEWSEIAEGWPAVAMWCADMAKDMEDVDAVIVHRTKVVHGEQPRAFFGGLGIPQMQPAAASTPGASTSSPKRSASKR